MIDLTLKLQNQRYDLVVDDGVVVNQDPSDAKSQDFDAKRVVVLVVENTNCLSFPNSEMQQAAKSDQNLGAFVTIVNQMALQILSPGQSSEQMDHQDDSHHGSEFSNKQKELALVGVNGSRIRHSLNALGTVFFRQESQEVLDEGTRTALPFLKSSYWLNEMTTWNLSEMFEDYRSSVVDQLRAMGDVAKEEAQRSCEADKTWFQEKSRLENQQRNLAITHSET
jgi:hypothetical protein